MELRLRRLLRKLRTAARISFDAVVGALHSGSNSSLRNNLTARPLFIADKTYNTAHPDYDPELARFFPNRIHQADRPCTNPLFLEILKLAKQDKVPKRSWHRIYCEVMEEAPFPASNKSWNARRILRDIRPN